MGLVLIPGMGVDCAVCAAATWPQRLKAAVLELHPCVRRLGLRCKKGNLDGWKQLTCREEVVLHVHRRTRKNLDGWKEQ